MSILILIPARYGSTRFPGKPLAPIAGKSMLSRVIEQALKAMDGYEDVDLIVASDNRQIMEHAAEHGASAILTPESCKTGTDRALAAIRQLPEYPDHVISLQGDVPLIPVNVIQKMINTIKNNPHLDVVTPVQNLSWNDLDRFRKVKEKTPFSGTTVVMDEDYRAIWFSKNIIPAIRNEKKLREEQNANRQINSSTDKAPAAQRISETYVSGEATQSESEFSRRSPVWRHIGLYGYKVNILDKFTYLEESFYESLEGLEQLRLLENGISIQCVPVEIPHGSLLSGIDTPEDLKRAEEILLAASDNEAQRR